MRRGGAARSAPPPRFTSASRSPSGAAPLAVRPRLPLLLPSTRLGQLARDPAVEGGVFPPVLLLERQRRELQRVEDVPQIELGHGADGVVWHLRPRNRSSPPARPMSHRSPRGRAPRSR